MQSMRDLLRVSLGRSLEAAPEVERLAVGWTVACGPVLAAHGRLTGFHNLVLDVEVETPAWLDQFKAMRPVLEQELARIAAVKLAGIHFYLRRSIS